MKNKEIVNCSYCRKEGEKSEMINNGTMFLPSDSYYHEECWERFKDKTGQ